MTTYTTSVGLQPGAYYRFRVYARSTVGLSGPGEIEILCGQIPDTPAAPSTEIEGLNVRVTWSAPYDGATPITNYQILLQHSDGVSYS